MAHGEKHLEINKCNGKEDENQAERALKKKEIYIYIYTGQGRK